MPDQKQSDPRFEVAAQALEMPAQQVQTQYGVLWPDLIYVWEQVLGRTAIVNRNLQVLTFEPGVLMPQALREFRREYPEIT